MLVMRKLQAKGGDGADSHERSTRVSQKRISTQRAGTSQGRSWGAAAPDGHAGEDKHVEAEIDSTEGVHFFYRLRLVLHVDDQLQPEEWAAPVWST